MYNANNHDPTAKTFTFAIYPDGGKTIPARAAAQGMQDGLDLILALARAPGDGASSGEPAVRVFHQRNGRRAGRRVISDLANVYMQNNYNIKAVLRRLFTAPMLSRMPSSSATRGRSSSSCASIKETGFTGLSVDAAMTPLVNMGQQIYEPPDVNGWALGARVVLDGVDARADEFRRDADGESEIQYRTRAADVSAAPPDQVLNYMLNRFNFAPITQDVYNAMLEYARGGGAWTGSDTQINNKGAGIGRLIVASSEFQFC